MHWVPLLKALQPPAGRGSIMAHLSLVLLMWHRVCNDKRRLATTAPAEVEVTGGYWSGTHIPLLPQLTVIYLVHTLGFLILFLSSLFFSYSLLLTTACNSFPRTS